MTRKPSARSCARCARADGWCCSCPTAAIPLRRTAFTGVGKYHFGNIPLVNYLPRACATGWRRTCACIPAGDLATVCRAAGAHGAAARWSLAHTITSSPAKPARAESHARAAGLGKDPASGYWVCRISGWWKRFEFFKMSRKRECLKDQSLFTRRIRALRSYIPSTTG